MRVHKFANDNTVSLNDKLLGSDFNAKNKTRNFPLSSILSFFNSYNSTTTSVQYRVFDYSDPKITLENYGVLFPENSEGRSELNASLISKFKVSKFSSEDEDLTKLFEMLDLGKESLVMKLRNPSISDEFYYFTVVGVAQYETYFEIDLHVIPSISSTDPFRLEESYSIDFLVKAPDFITTDIPVTLRSGHTLGKYKSGDVIFSKGWSIEQLMKDIALDYVPPVFTLFTVDSQPTIVEVGTTLRGTRTFRWDVSQNSAIVPDVDIYDMTAGTTLASATINDGMESLIVTNIKLDADAQTQSWKAIANSVNQPKVDSSRYTVTARHQRYFGAVAALPASLTDGTANRTYANNLSRAFQSSGVNTFTLITGVAQKTFVVILPPSKVITNVTDITNLGLDITTDYKLSSITVKDAGGTDRAFNLYTLTLDEPYNTSSNHVIKTN